MERGREEEMESGRKAKRGGGCFEERWMGGSVDLLIPGASVVLYIHTHTTEPWIIWMWTLEGSM